MRSDQGARLKNSHQTTIASVPAMATIIPITEASGTTAGTTSLNRRIATAATTPGHNRSGCEALVAADSRVSILLHSDLSACRTSTWDARAAGVNEATSAALTRTPAAPSVVSTPGTRTFSR